MTINKSAQGGKNKRKGSAFEREVAKQLSMWIYGSNDILRRSPSSGAEHQFAQGADIGLFQPNALPFNYFVELKNGYKSDIINFRKQILEWTDKSKRLNKLKWPIWLIWKIPHKGIFFIVNEKFNHDELLIINELYIYNYKEVLNKRYKEIIRRK